MAVRTCINGIFFSVDKNLKMASVAGYDPAYNFGRVDIPEIVEDCEVIAINHDAFYKCKTLESVYIPRTIVAIHQLAFAFCENLKEVHMYYGTCSSARALSIDTHAFMTCKSLEEVILLNKTVSVGTNVFQDCENLKKFTGDIVVLGSSAFSGCSQINNLIFADNCKLYSNAFCGCKKLKNLTFLGEINEFSSSSAVKKLQGKNMHLCVGQFFNHMDWVYTGTKIEVL